MRFLHLADLHIGKRVNEFSMIEDQRYILTRILNIIDENKVEAVLIAGDVYDKPVPSAEAVMLLSDFLGKLAKRKLQVFVISGNHDSAERIGFGAELMSLSGVHMSRPFEGVPECVRLKDKYGEIHIYMLPFIKPAYVRNCYPEEEIGNYDEAMRVVMEHTEIDKKYRNILVAHQFVSGGATCDSEDISVGGLDEISADYFKKFDYTALGHLHRPQHIGSEYIRYSGTPLKYSFSEVSHKKVALIIDMKDKGEISFEEIPLQPRYDLREISGTYMEVTAREFYEKFPKDDYMHVTLKDEEDIPDAIGKLRTIYPNIMRLDYDNKRTRSTVEVVGTGDVEQKTPFELFQKFYENQNNQEMSEEQKEFTLSLMESIWEVRN